VELGELIMDKVACGVVRRPFGLIRYKRKTDITVNAPTYAECQEEIRPDQDVSRIPTPASKLDSVPWTDGILYNAANAMLNDVNESVGLVVRLPGAIIDKNETAKLTRI
jgi:hypothetical protein